MFDSIEPENRNKGFLTDCLYRRLALPKHPSPESVLPENFNRIVR